MAVAADKAPVRRRRGVVALALGLAAVAVLAWALKQGGTAGQPVTPMDTTGHFMIAVTVVLAVSQLLGRVMALLRQPAVVGEVLGGLLLGPSMLGFFAPGPQAWLFPAPVLAAVQQLAQIGLVAFVFLLGWDQDARELRSSGRAAALVGLTCLVVPFGSGLLIGIPLSAGQPRGQLPSALFLALALSITALPVLARVLDELGLTGRRIGRLVISAAVLDDAASWAVLAVILPFAGRSSRPVLVTLAATVALVLALFLLVRPALATLVRRLHTRNAELALLGIAMAGSLATATLTEMIGLHSILGAFLFGLVMPRRKPEQKAVSQRLHSFTVAVLLPLFFAYVGLQTSLSAVAEAPGGWWIALLVLVVAMLAKFGGGLLGGRLAGFGWRESGVIGALMNCRGITELVVANLGLALGLIDRRMFGILVLVALVTTALTAPAVRLLTPRPECHERVFQGKNCLERPFHDT
ncbi:cation:proton antiporter [Amycolatopsis sp. H20-H5]|uniref:cation:proton antiporter n=1 Tax=Amycolatopsis sp. H20-H5 TaxID=3046309 RepID=UPI002DB89A27|nr:cation:proton antiporter [Amycolatopsis sp. H20-H5]MEC3978119.1 cation:proton antiporter [Amycolatopsis sp. H20-H5]